MTEMTETVAGVLRFRSAEQVGVNHKQRLIELVVTPYEQEALVEHQGRMVHEIFSREAYSGIERRANRIRANRDHDTRRTVGRAVALHPSRAEGLVAELRIARTDLGDETLALAEDECLDASAGYLPFPDGGEVWETRSRVRIRKAYLGHIALVAEPAYEGARVLAVRQAPTRDASNPSPGPQATPNLDQARAWMLEDRLKQFERQ